MIPMKKILAAITALAAAVMLSGCSGGTKAPAEPLDVDLAPEYEQGCITPPFWVVEDRQTGAQIFLLGSFHAGKADVSYPGYVLDALSNSSWAAAELDTVAFGSNIALQRKCISYITLSGTTAADCIGDSYDETLDYFRSKGIYQPVMEKMTPFYWASAANALIFEQTGLNTGLGTETLLLNYAKKKNIEIREIEGAEAQYKMMGEIPMNVQLELLAQCVGDDNITAQANSAVELYEAWSSFDEDYLSGLTVFDPDTVADPDSWQAYYDMMYTDRQALMAEFITDSLKAGELGFVFVGTLHYYAEPSVITLLERSGYEVKKVCPEHSAAENESLPAA